MLRKKRVRTFKRYRAQFVSMIIMICLGIGVFVGFNMEWYSLLKDTGFIFEKTGFADYRIYSEEGFSEKDLEAIKGIEGVTDATRFLTVNAAVKGDSDVVAIAMRRNARSWAGWPSMPISPWSRPTILGPRTRTRS